MNLNAHIAINPLLRMEMQTENMAAINATSRTGSGVVVMGDKQFDNEKQYQVSMSLARKFLSDGTITERNYQDFDVKMQQKYKPTFSKLFTDISLENYLI